MKKNFFQIFHRTQNTLLSYLNSGKDKVPNQQQRGIYSIPCDCGKRYVGRTERTFGKRLAEHEQEIDHALSNGHRHNYTFKSALAEHIFENPSHSVYFEKAQILATCTGLHQTIREAVEIKNKTKGFDGIPKI